MLKKLTSFMALLVAAIIPAIAQVVTYTPDPITEDSQDVVVYFHADKGSKGLANLPATTPVYAHCGVITTVSKHDADWQHATVWDKNLDKYKMTYVSPNLYKLEIGNVRKFFGVNNDDELVSKIAFVFRNADGSKTGKADGNKDILIPVVITGNIVTFTSDAATTTISEEDPDVTFTLTSTKPADKMWISINGNRIKEVENATTLSADYTFTEVGSYSIYGNVQIGEKITSKSLSLAYVISGEKKDYPGGVPRMGAVRADNGNVIFCIAAPGKVAVKLIGSWNNFDAGQDALMYSQDYEGQRYFWKEVEGLDKTSQYLYYFNVDNTKNVGDPYARLVLDPQNDKYIPKTVYPDLPAYPSNLKNIWLAVYQENINDFEWTDTDFKAPAKSDLVIYELLLRDFTGTEGRADGNGTVKKALEKLPYLKALGVNAIELLPINEFNGNISWGYNPNFYFAPDKAYGTPDDYKEFINTCHENGIAVILDMVFNQSDWQHPWYQMYAVGQNPFYNADAPHAYSVLNDINQGHPLIRRQWKDVVKYWMEEYHIDGYRFDLVKGLGDNDSYANNGDAATNAYNASRVANMHAIQQAMAEINPDAYFINENLAGAKEENEMAAFGMLNWANINDPGCQFAMGYSSNSSLNRMYAPNDNRTWGSTVAYLESHDEERLAYKQLKWGAAGVKDNHANACRRLGSAAAQMILVPGAHMIWQFSEMGNAQTTKNADGGNNVDPKIVNWNLLDDPDNKGLYDCYSELIRLRLLNADLFTEDAEFQMNCTSNDWSRGRTIKASKGDKELIAVINPSITSEATVNVTFSSSNAANYGVASKSYATNPAFNVAAGTVTLPANSYAVIVNDKVLDVEGIEADLIPGSMKVFATPGAISVENAQAGFSIFDVKGVCHFSSADSEGSALLPAGLYIVKSGAECVKTIVR